MLFQRKFINELPPAHITILSAAVARPFSPAVWPEWPCDADWGLVEFKDSIILATVVSGTSRPAWRFGDLVLVFREKVTRGTSCVLELSGTS